MIAFILLPIAAYIATASPGEAGVWDDECSLMHRTAPHMTVLNQGTARVMSFPEFVAQHRRAYLPGSDEYTMRKGIYEALADRVHKVNSDPSRLWTAGLSKLADRTKDELSALRGYNRHLRASFAAGSNDLGMASSEAALVEFGTPQLLKQGRVEVPQDLNWGDKLVSLAKARDQGGCGSCWAFAAGNVLRAQSEIHTSERDFSVQELVSCVPNPEHCGGSGGCTGATVELAMDYVLRHGSLTEEQMPYTGMDERCPVDRHAEVHAQMLAESKGGERENIYRNKGEDYGMVGWMRLPENRILPMKQALVTHGPLGVALMVSDLFQLYINGILPACDQDAVINHAVTLVGFGVDDATSTKFWRIQNSWGSDWGEGGFLRLVRLDDDAEESHCGWDSQPEVGNGCDGGPERVWVCGACGILNDVVSPIFRGGPNSKKGFAYDQFSVPALFKDPANATIAKH